MPSTPQEALDRIAGMCDDHEQVGSVRVADVRAVLAEVSPEPGVVTIAALEQARDDWDAPLGASYARQIWDKAIAIVRSTDAGGVLDRDALSDREREWLIDVAQEGTATLLETVQSIESDPVASEDEMENAVRYGVRADCGQGAIDKVAAGALVRPVAGVTLTPEEARIVRWLLIYWGTPYDPETRNAPPPSRESVQALAARLKGPR